MLHVNRPNNTTLASTLHITSVIESDYNVSYRCWIDNDFGFGVSKNVLIVAPSDGGNNVVLVAFLQSKENTIFTIKPERPPIGRAVCETRWRSSQSDCPMYCLPSFIPKNDYARPCICMRLERGNNTKIAILVMRRLRQVHLSPVFAVNTQK